MAYSFDLAVLCLRHKTIMKRLRRKRRRYMCKSHEPSPEIPFELQIDILTRLPVKSLMRFKSVSTCWSSLLCSQYFTDRFLKVSSSPLRIFMWLGFGNKKVLLSASCSPDSDLSSIVVDQDLSIPSMEGYYVSHVYRGLMCLVKGQSAQIYNTSTRQIVLLPDIDESKLIAENHERKKIMYHIGHDPLYNQYKVVCTVSRPSEEVGTYMSEHWVLLLGGDGSSRWRKIVSPFQPHNILTQGLTIDGRMHYLAWVHTLYPVLVNLDIRSEEIISIVQETENQAFWPRFAHLIEYGGRVAILHHSDFEDRGVIELWVMEDEEKNSWSKKTLVLHPSQMHILTGISLRVQGTTRNGEVIFVPHNTSGTPMRKIVVEPQSTTLFHVFLYNLETNFLRKIEIKDTSNRYPTKIWDVIGWDDVENLMYL